MTGRRWPVLRVFLRSLAIQGSWNYRSMLGGGFAFALLPFLEDRFRDDPEGFRAALQRHVEHFNAHPYLAGVALGAVIRMESEGTDPEAIRRFKTAVRGPLGGLGDTLVWVGWLPALVLGALVPGLLGARPWLVAVLFLLVYNAGHLLLRVWGFRVGLRQGPAVATRLRSADLGGVGVRLQGVGVFFLGAVLGILLLGGAMPVGGPAWPWIGAAVLFFVVGAGWGRAVWRLAGAGFVGLLLGLLLLGAMA